MLAVGPQRPLVVLFGWLGCQPSNLRRYVKLYSAMGFCVWFKVATPVMVVNSAFLQTDLTVPRTWPHQQKLSSAANTMEELAWSLLAEVDSSKFSFVFFHVFSNGGCFLWEKTARIFHLGQVDHTSSLPDDMPRPVQLRLESLRERVVGTVFDSCPGFDLHRLPDALNHCSWTEKMKVLISTRYAYFDLPSVQKEVQLRCEDYKKALTDDSWNLPQLYIYSENDNLAPFQDLKELVMRRQQLHGSDIVWSKTWSKSGHCSHYYHHPDDYRETISSFTKVCAMHSLPKNQLSRI